MAMLRQAQHGYFAACRGLKTPTYIPGFPCGTAFSRSKLGAVCSRYLPEAGPER